MTCDTATQIDDALARFISVDSQRLMDGVRERARAQIRELVSSRSYSAGVSKSRRPQTSADMPAIVVEMNGGSPGYHFQGESKCAYSALTVTSWSLVPSESSQLAVNVHRLLTAFASARVNGATWCGTRILFCHLLSPSRSLSARAFDGSDEWWFGEQQVWRVMHDQVVPETGFALAF